MSTGDAIPTARDLDLFAAMLQYRFLRRDQLDRLFFPGIATSTVNRRLTRLVAAGFLARERPPLPYGEGTSQYYYYLTPRAAEALVVAERVTAEAVNRHLRRDRAAGQKFREHSLAINEFHVLITLAAQAQGWQIEDWQGDFELGQLKLRVDIPRALRLRPTQTQLPVTPDGFFTVVRRHPQTGEALHSSFFLEVDRATEEQRRFQQKVVAYLAYKLSGQYTQRFQRQSLRVLTVTTSQTRLRNLLAGTRQVQGGNLFWFAVLGELTAQNIFGAPVWYPAHLDQPQGLFTY